MNDAQRTADRLEGEAHALEQSLAPQLNAIKTMREEAARLRRDARPGPVPDTGGTPR